MATVALSPRRPASASREGASWTQGGHQVAKKLTKTGRPRRLRSDTFLPVRSGNSKFGTNARRVAESGSGRSTAQAPSEADLTVEAAPSISRAPATTVAAA